MYKRIVLFLITICCFAAMATAANKNFTLVIDAGHGGGDAGAIGKAGVKEKNLTLKFALAFGRLVEQNCPDVKVIYTRKTDKFVELYKRAEIANKNKADLFISIHINAVPKGHTVRGFQTYTLGKSRRTGKNNGVLENLEVAKRENEVIFLEKDYKQTYHGYDPNSPESDILFEFIQDKNMENSIELAKYMQKYVCQATGRQDMGAHQDNLAVLRLTSMPGCLIELGFISTRDEEQYMNTSLATEQYARGIFNAFAAYKKRFSGGITVPYMAEPKAEPKPEPKPESKPEPKPEPKPESKPEPKQSVQPDTPEVTDIPGNPENPGTPDKPATSQPQPKQQEVKSPEPKSSETGPIFKVQILTSPKKLNTNDSRFKGTKNTDCYQEGGLYKYTVGASEDFNKINQLRKDLLAKFPEAFLIAFKDGKRVNVQDAIKEFKSKKVK